jgi:DUF971 family protein
MANDPFIFTVTDVGRFLGKSPVTLRAWERRGLLVLSRDQNGDRRADLAGLRTAATAAEAAGRISRHRLNLVEAAVTLLDLIEKENE